jgi:hypothetical protein
MFKKMENVKKLSLDPLDNFELKLKHGAKTGIIQQCR